MCTSEDIFYSNKITNVFIKLFKMKDKLTNILNSYQLRITFEKKKAMFNSLLRRVTGVWRVFEIIEYVFE